MVSRQYSVLIVDDEATLRMALSAALSAGGFKVEQARSGEEALDLAQRRAFDLAMLDINMPGIGGVETCRRLRDVAPHSGIVMVTVCDTEGEKIGALEAGADDYVTKPFRLRELVARLRAVLRRTRHEAPELELLQVGNLKMDVKARILWRGDEAVHLSPTEFKLLVFLMNHPNTVLTHAEILSKIWGPGYAQERDYLRSYIRALRKKIEDSPAKPQYILTEAWVGYRFCNPTRFDSPLNAIRQTTVAL
jgi:two-component system KDP operon response regulator KdpE